MTETEGGTSTIDFVCGPDQTEIADTTAAPGTGLGTNDASLDFFIPSAPGLHYVKITTTSDGGKTVHVADLINDETSNFLDVGASVTGTFGTPTDRDGVEVSMVNGTSYQIDLRSVGYPGIDPWIIDIYDQVGRITRPAGMFGASYAGFFDHDSGPGNAARVIYTATKTEDHYIVVGSRGSTESAGWADWHLKVTEASAPFYDDYAADAVHRSGRPWLWAALLCRAGLIRLRVGTTPVIHGGPSDLLVWLPPLP